MKIKAMPVGVYAANCYIVIDEGTKACVVMDPGGDEEDLIKYIKEEKAEVKYILLTHGHADHTEAALKLKEEFNAPLCINAEDYEMIKNSEFMYGNIAGKVDKYIKEDDNFKVGNMDIKCIHTPGHTPGGVCFLIGNCVFTGDTLFAGSIGRTDFAGGNFETIIKSIKDKLMILNDEIKVFPGHGPESSI
jgi:glyoxylase-like metal-dependent hydrolase (beta-lactamase superfamily II)